MSRFEHHRFWQRALRVALGSSAIALLTLGVSCPPAELGDIEVTIVRAVDTVGQLCPITSVSWQVDPVAVPLRPSGSPIGTTARPAAFTNYSGGTGTTSGGTSQFPIVCVHTGTIAALAPGTWAVTGKAVRGNAFTCNKQVTAGGTTKGATWVFNKGGTAESCT